MPLARGEAVEYDRNHTKVKHTIILDHEVLIMEAVLISKTTFIYKSLGLFCGFYEKCFIHHILSGISLSQMPDQL